MRKAVVLTSLPQDVCIFCATRILNASAKPAQRTQRRVFSSTRDLRKPPAGGAAALKRQDADEDGWAAYSPPVNANQQRSTEAKTAPGENSIGGRQEEGEGARDSLQKRLQEGSQRGLGDLRQRASGISKDSSYSLNSNSEQRGANIRFTNRRTTNLDFGNTENTWQGLRRRTLPAGESESRWKGGRGQDGARSDGTYRNEEQQRRLEASRQGDFVELGGLNRRNRWSSPDERHQASDLARKLEGRSGFPRGWKGGDPAIGSDYAVPAFRVQFGKHGVSPNSSATYTSGPAERGTGTLRWRPSSSNSESRTTVDQDTESPLEGSQRDGRRGRLPRTESTNTADLDTMASLENSQQDDRPRREFQHWPPPSEVVAPTRRIERRSDDPRRTTTTQRRTERKQAISGRSSAPMEDDRDDDEFAERRAARKRRMEKAKEREKPTPIYLPEFIRVSNLAIVVKARSAELLEKMEDLGFEGITNDHVLDAETAGLVAAEYNFEPIVEQTQEQDLEAQPPIEDKSSLLTRPPVVTIMGHVDHGKTTLLDFLRKSSVAASEHGGITQHIGAFSVPMSGGRLVTFLDTPGHAAFLAMRQRGANVTDIVILVVAADDSVMAQTLEAIKHAQAAKVPIIVAINKVDKEDARPEQVKQDLARHGIEIEDFGGDTQVVCVSGKTGKGMAELEDAVVALADILDHRAPTEGLVEGWVLEGQSNKAGRVATILVRRGTLRPGDVIVAGTSWARVRSLRNEANAMVEFAGPGTPVAVDGWREQPTAGDEVLQTPNNSEQRAKSVIEHRQAASQQEQLAKDITVVNEARQLASQRHLVEKAQKLAARQAKRALRRNITMGEEIVKDDEDAHDENTAGTSADGDKDAGPQQQDVFFILKADVSGSVEAVHNAITSLGTPEIQPIILRSAVGPITEFDIEHAAAAKGHIINFNAPIEQSMARLAEEQGVQVLDQSIIYRLIDQVRDVLAERLPKLVTKRVVGEAEVAQVFEWNVRGRLRVPVAGCRVRNGEIGRKGRVRVMRGGEEVYDGTLGSLKHVKKDINEARKGTECGIGFEGWTKFQVGDQVQSYEEIVEKRTL